MIARTSVLLFLMGMVILPVHAAFADEGSGAITFKKVPLDDVFRSEGCAVADFNGDGRADIAAGSVYYAAPDWKMRAIDETPREYDPKAYSNSFCNFADDVNRDGWADLIVVDFPGQQTWWFENPKGSAGAWKRHVATPATNNESPDFLDLDGDGRREILFSDGNFQMAYARPGDGLTEPWRLTPISQPKAPGTAKFSHGLGAGDVNGDGAHDILVNQGWWQAPSNESGDLWKFHPADFGPACAHMHVYDFDGDGDNDVLNSSAHAYGIWWHEQTDEGWQTHEIERSFSQTHSLCLADINGDGLMDFVTGKRWWAHGGNDPGGGEPAVMFWFELTRRDGRPIWIAHQFDHDSGIGTQFEVADINGDGWLDVATANKKGVRVFLQERE